MKSSSVRFVGLMLCFFLLTVAFAPSTGLAADKQFKWRMATLYPRGVSFAKTFPPFCELVKAMSAGRMVIDMVYEGEGISGADIWANVKMGLIELGRPYFALHSGEFPAGLVGLGLPGGSTDKLELLTLHTRGGLNEALSKAMAPQGLCLLGGGFQPGTYLLTKEPIKNLDQLKGLKIRAPGSYGKMMRNLGASPVLLTYSELYTALATGVIDGLTGPNLVDFYSSKFYEVAPYLYPIPVSGAQFVGTSVNMKAWNTLPEDLKAIVRTAEVTLGVDQTTMGYYLEGTGLKEMKTLGLKMSPDPSAEDRGKWKKAGMDTWAEYGSKDKDTKDLIKIMKEFYDKME